ncbi:nucleoside phosphorylase [Gramella sp. AN32]|uniref:Uridine phosphorylase n=1 Tax=Christiangramia antarctica TaxID=2058158 RepID=A0ABW5X026_9FLAO|nr:nucleoside phosphorylase [Gramella sp. AN32]MCM4156799.1 phosphorylase [Gramella sp. AN32]
MSFKPSELILNSDGSIYHLNLFPEELAPTVITVGDPERVTQISKLFDRIELKKQKREFTIHTGEYSGKRITVMSTGMGTDNIDIAFTELDALVNIDLKKKEIKEELTSLEIIRIGTTGSIRNEIPVDSFLVSEKAIGFDGLMHFYNASAFLDESFAHAFIEQTQWSSKKAKPYVVQGDQDLIQKMSSSQTIPGFTATNIGFYGPQGRVLRLSLADEKMNERLNKFAFNGQVITNLEMETSGIYGMSKLLGHKAVSMNAVVANRETGEFSKDPGKLMENLIQYSLEKLVS